MAAGAGGRGGFDFDFDLGFDASTSGVVPAHIADGQAAR
jgi:hypothetical protein